MLTPSIKDLKSSYNIYSTINERSQRYNNTYYLNSEGYYLTTLIDKNSEITKVLEDNDSSYLIVPKYEILDEIDVPAQFKTFTANSRYIGKYIKVDKDGKKIDSNRKDVIYTQQRNIDSVKHLVEESIFYTEIVGNNPEIIILPDNLEIPVYYKNPMNLKNDIRNDFVLVPSSDKEIFLDYIFEFRNEESKEMLIKALAPIVDVNQIDFKKIVDDWDGSLELYKNLTAKNVYKILSYVLIIVIISLLCYQTSFDKEKREFSIYWINGIDRFNYFLKLLGTFILESILVVFFIRYFQYPGESVSHMLFILSFIIFIDVLSLLIFRIKFLNEINANIKEHI